MSSGFQKFRFQVLASAERSGDGSSFMLRQRAFIVLKGAVITAATWFAYWPALHGGLFWDDPSEITINTALRSRAGLWSIWFSPDTPDYYPLKTSLQWVQWHLWGSQVTGYHVTNVCLHLLSAFLLWRVLHKLGVRLAWLGGLIFAVHPLAVESVAWISELKNVLSLPFLLLAMSAWIDWDEIVGRSKAQKAQNKATDSDQARDEGVRLPLVNSRGEFASGSLTPSAASDGGAGTRRPTSENISGLRSLPRRSVAETGHPSYFCDKKRLLSLALFVLAMLCKSSVVMFPVILLLYCWWKRGKVTRSDLRSTAPFFAVSLVLGLVTVWFQEYVAIKGIVVPQGGALSRLAVAGMAVMFYLWKFIWPVGLLPIYPRWKVDPPVLWQFWPWVVIVGVLVGLLAIQYPEFFGRKKAQNAQSSNPEVGRRVPAPPVGAESKWRRGDASPHLIFGFGFFFINLLPVLGFVPMSFLRISWVADHFAYMPMVGLVGLTVAGIGRVFVVAQVSRLPSLKLQAGTPPLLIRTSVSLALAALILALVVESRRDARHFASEKAAWTYTLAHNPDAWLAHNNLSNILLNENRIADAKEQIEDALRLKPDFAEAHNNLGNILLQTGDPEKAKREFEDAIRFRDGYAEAYNGLGNYYLKTGQPARAIELYTKALGIKPDYTDCRDNLGAALENMGRDDEAIAEYRKVIQVKPDFAAAHYNMGIALAKAGQVSGAITEYEAAVRLDPTLIQALNNLGNALGAAGRISEAIARYEQALRVNPNFFEAHINLGNALCNTRHYAGAIEQFEAAIRLLPGYSPGHNNLGIALAAVGRISEARAQFEEALRYDPNNRDARRNLQRLGSRR